MDGYFCKVCGTRLAHAKRDAREDGVISGQVDISIKGGCVEGLDWSQAEHIFWNDRVVNLDPPEGVVCWEQELGGKRWVSGVKK